MPDASEIEKLSDMSLINKDDRLEKKERANINKSYNKDKIIPNKIIKVWTSKKICTAF